MLEPNTAHASHKTPPQRGWPELQELLGSCTIHADSTWVPVEPWSSICSGLIYLDRATHFSWGVPPEAWLSWLGFCGGLGFCCSGGRPPGPPWPWAAAWGCWVVARALCCCEPPCDCCLVGWAGLSCCCWPAAFWPLCCCCWDTDCCLWFWGPWPEDGLWPWGAAWPGGRVWAAPWLALVEPPSADCWACTGGWPWGCGRCWDGGVCWGPPGEEMTVPINCSEREQRSFWKIILIPWGEGRCWVCGSLGCETDWGDPAFCWTHRRLKGRKSIFIR